MNPRCSRILGAFLLALATQAFATPPDGMIQINYHRCDGKYAKWGVHLWEDPNLPLDGIDWQHPMMPTGPSPLDNAPWVYWQVSRAKDVFNMNSSGTVQNVNYIIHNRDAKEQGGKDMKFNAVDHQEIWVINNDSQIYFSLADAQSLSNDPCFKVMAPAPAAVPVP